MDLVSLGTFFIQVLLFGSSVYALSWMLRRKFISSVDKSAPAESAPKTEFPTPRLQVHFLVLSVVFLFFSGILALLVPWALSYKNHEHKMLLLQEAGFLAGTMALAFCYVLLSKVHRWGKAK